MDDERVAEISAFVLSNTECSRKRYETLRKFCWELLNELNHQISRCRECGYRVYPPRGWYDKNANTCIQCGGVLTRKV